MKDNYKLDKSDEVYAAMTEFRIFHGLSDERLKIIDDLDLSALWLQWRVDHKLPLEKEKWNIHYNCWEVLLHCLDLWYKGKHLGEIDLAGPASSELERLLQKKKAA
jgi:hypothetical protein